MLVWFNSTCLAKVRLGFYDILAQGDYSSTGELYLKSGLTSFYSAIVAFTFGEGDLGRDTV